MNRIFKELKLILGTLDISYKDLASKCGMKSKTQIYRILHKNRSVNLDTFIRICTALEQINHELGCPIENDFIKPWSVLERALKE